MAGQEDSLFYYGGGERIMLEHDGRGVMIATASAEEGRAVIEAVAREIGASRLERIVVPSAPGNSFIPTRSLSPAQIDEAVQRLRADPRVEFVSPTYRTRVGHHTFTPIG